MSKLEYFMLLRGLVACIISKLVRKWIQFRNLIFELLGIFCACKNHILSRKNGQKLSQKRFKRVQNDTKLFENASKWRKTIQKCPRIDQKMSGKIDFKVILSQDESTCFYHKLFLIYQLKTRDFSKKKYTSICSRQRHLQVVSKEDNTIEI